MHRRTLIRSSAFMLAISAVGPLALAQEAYPAKPVTMVVSFSAGGNNDVRARQIGGEVSKMLGKAIIVENKPGASGNIGHAYLARAGADGYTLGIGAMGPLAVNSWIFPKLGFDPIKDFTPIVLIEKAPLVLVTRVDKPYKSVADVIAAAKAKPGAITIGNAGTGGAHHLSGELFKQQSGIDLLAVPYKGGGPAAGALLAGEIDMMFEQTYAALPSIQGGKIRPLAVTSEKRLPSLPDVPTMTELGFPKVTVSNWLGLIGPKDMPPAIVKKLNESFNTALAIPDLRTKITGLGNEIGGGTPEQFAALIASENKRWGQVVKSANIKLD
ncbi:Bug family tripartite tricarboxylate transporter substrate binding protein [Noviherbaspirillum aerium]|uniref:Bug family tripartite tricarboxylate transporter substrate binding protein n=1 Tax=Noviherbaspirillum aerium TaxID=2588497 RepID=UPI00124E1986|nr:tripartite tricarboxylate transporter substrate binding protein [Noviherbaspirillum aerium]